MKFLSILVAKTLIKLGNLIGKGSCFPGSVALKIDKNILEKLNINSKIIAVTGSSGKGSTSSVIVNALTNLGHDVIYNYKGANLNSGIATLLLENCDFKGNINSDYIVLEMDERYAKYVFGSVKPDYLVVTNITRDQPPRQGNFDIVKDDIKKSIQDNTKLILNGDDPYLRKLVKDLDNKAFYYSVNKNSSSTTSSMFKNLNITRCPICNSKLIYDYYNFEHLGKYKCSKCDFSSPESFTRVTNIDFDANTITLNEKYNIHLVSRLLFNVYNVAAAYTVLKLLGINENEISNQVSKQLQNKKIYSQYKYKDRNVYTLNNKNENATTFNQSLMFLNTYDCKKTIVVGWKEISRRYKFNDISWLYDVDFEILKNHEIDKVICIGVQNYDIATRIYLAGIEANKIKTFETVKEGTDYIKGNTNGDIFAILNFDYVEPFNENMKGDVIK